MNASMTSAQPSETASTKGELPLGRLEAFSDGVFAIAITLLALELAVAPDAGADLLQGILALWPAFLAYLTSFLTIGAAWIAHSTITGALRAADGTLYRLNLLVLLFASFLPFPTKLAAEFLEAPEPEKVAMSFYGLTLFALGISLLLFTRYAFEQRRLVKDHIDDETVQAVVRRGPSYAFLSRGDRDRPVRPDDRRGHVLRPRRLPDHPGAADQPPVARVRGT
jgi:uncharacterized membrane protein